MTKNEDVSISLGRISVFRRCLQVRRCSKGRTETYSTVLSVHDVSWLNSPFENGLLCNYLQRFDVYIGYCVLRDGKQDACTIDVYQSYPLLKRGNVHLVVVNFDRASWINIGMSIFGIEFVIFWSANAHYRLHYKADRLLSFSSKPRTTIFIRFECHCRQVFALNNYQTSGRDFSVREHPIWAWEVVRKTVPRLHLNTLSRQYYTTFYCWHLAQNYVDVVASANLQRSVQICDLKYTKPVPLSPFRSLIL